MRRRIHATEQQLGYYRHYRSRYGDVLRLIRMQAWPVDAEPVPAQSPLRLVAEILAGVVVIMALIVGVLSWLAILSVQASS